MATEIPFLELRAFIDRINMMNRIKKAILHRLNNPVDPNPVQLLFT
jgi:hypothetical protein